MSMNQTTGLQKRHGTAMAVMKWGLITVKFHTDSRLNWLDHKFSSIVKTIPDTTIETKLLAVQDGRYIMLFT